MRTYFSGLISVGSLATALVLGCGSSVATGGGGSGATATGTGTTGTGTATAATTGAGGDASTTGAGGAGGSGGSPPLGPFVCSGVVVKFAADVAPVFNGCSGGDACHALAAGFQTPAKSYAYLVGQMTNECMDGRLRATPGDPEHSYVIDKLTGHNLCSGSGMPKGFGVNGKWKPRPAAEIQKVYDWICTGAKND
ncbi:MAG: hypothetical protein ABJE95_26885 [Byssovorax sp.]